MNPATVVHVGGVEPARYHSQNSIGLAFCTSFSNRRVNAIHPASANIPMHLRCIAPAERCMPIEFTWPTGCLLKPCTVSTHTIKYCI